MRPSGSKAVFVTSIFLLLSILCGDAGEGARTHCVLWGVWVPDRDGGGPAWAAVESSFSWIYQRLHHFLVRGLKLGLWHKRCQRPQLSSAQDDCLRGCSWNRGSWFGLRDGMESWKELTYGIDLFIPFDTGSFESALSDIKIATLTFLSLVSMLYFSIPLFNPFVLSYLKCVS